MYGNAVMLIIAIATWMSLPLAYGIMPGSQSVAEGGAQCPSGKFTARLTGWAIDGRLPSGSATFDTATNRLEVTVESVNLPDGKVLSVLIGEERIGDIGTLTGNSAKGSIGRTVKEGDRVRVFDADRPIVSGNLVCVAAPAVTVGPTASPVTTPTPSPSPTTSISSPTPSPSPTATASPTPSPSPGATTSPVPTPIESPTVTPLMTPSPQPAH